MRHWLTQLQSSEVPRSVVCKLETQERQWCSSNTCEPEVRLQILQFSSGNPRTKSPEDRGWTSQLRG